MRSLLIRAHVENMAAERVAGRDAGVIEVKLGMVNHAQSFHHAAGGKVGGHGEGDDLRQAQGLEAVIEHGAGAFGGESATPVGIGQAPADFYRAVGYSGDGKGQDLGADEADEGSILDQLGGEEAEAMTVDVSAEALDGGVALFPREGAGEVFANARVGVHGREGRQVGVFPGAENEAWGAEHESKATLMVRLNSRRFRGAGFVPARRMKA